MKHLMLLGSLILWQGLAYAQWVPLHGPETHTTTLLDAGKYVLAGTSDGVFRSSDEGLHWEIVPDLPKHFNCHSLAGNQDGSQQLAVLRDDACKCLFIYKSTDQGESWGKIITPGFADYFSAIYSGDNGYILASTSRIQDNEVFHTNWESFDGGKQWRRNFMDTLSNYAIQGIRLYGNQLWGFNEKYLFKGGNYGENWQIVADSPDGLPIIGYLLHGDSILLNTAGSLYSRLWRSVDAGISWTELPYAYSIHNILISNEVWLSIGAFDLLLASHDKGSSWSVQTPDSIHLKDFIQKGDYILGYESSSGIVRSEDQGKHFFRTYNRLGHGCNAGPLIVSDRKLFVGAAYEENPAKMLAVYQTDQDSWTFRNSPKPNVGFDPITDDLAGLDGRLFACMDVYQVLRSDDQGETWNACTNPFNWPDIPTGTNMFTSDHSLFLFNTFWNTNHALYRSDDYGNIWKDIDLPESIGCYHDGMLASAMGLTIFAGGKLGNCLFKSSDKGDSWVTLDLPAVPVFTDTAEIGLTSMTTTDHMLHITLSRYERNQWDYFSFVSNDHGETWNESNAPIGHRDIDALSIPTAVHVDSFDLISSYGAGVLITQDSGKNWTPFMVGLPGLYIHDLTIDNTHIYASVLGHGIWKRAISDIRQWNGGSGFNTEYIASPNPSTGLVRITAVNSIQNGRIEWFDMSGRLCLAEDIVFTCQKAVVNLPFANGQYHYQIQNESGSYGGGKVILMR